MERVGEKPAPSSWRPSGNRLVAIVAGLVVLVVLAIVAVAAGGGDDDAAPTTTTAPSAPAGGETGDDATLAARLLPVAAAFGPDWVESARDDEATPVTEVPDDPCAVGPIPDGVLIHGELRRLVDNDVQESLAVTAGVLASGAEPADLADPAVRDCLRTGLGQAVQPGATVALVEDPEPAVAVAGAEVAVARFAVTTADGGAGGVFDFVLVRRGRGVALGLLAGLPDAGGTPLADVAAALDAPLAAVADQLG